MVEARPLELQRSADHSLAHGLRTPAGINLSSLPQEDRCSVLHDHQHVFGRPNVRSPEEAEALDVMMEALRASLPGHHAATIWIDAPVPLLLLSVVLKRANSQHHYNTQRGDPVVEVEHFIARILPGLS